MNKIVVLFLDWKWKNKTGQPTNQANTNQHKCK